MTIVNSGRYSDTLTKLIAWFYQVFDRYGFPVQVQKWIVGKRIPRPQDTLRDLNVRQSGHTVFLYLLSGKTVGLRKSDAERLGRGNSASTSLPGSTASSAAETTAAASTQMRRATSTPSLSVQGERSTLSASRAEPLPTVHQSPPTSFQNPQNSGPATMPSTLQPGVTIDQLRNLLRQQYGSQGDVSNPADPPQEEAFVNNLETAQQPTEEDGRALGWTCPVCTYINQPTRPGCEMCSSDRPAEYVVPDGTRLDERERTRIAAEERSEALFQQVCAIHTNPLLSSSIASHFCFLEYMYIVTFVDLAYSTKTEITSVLESREICSVYESLCYFGHLAHFILALYCSISFFFSINVISVNTV